MKECSKCKNSKSLSDFYKKKSSKDGFQKCCKRCSNLVVNSWTSRNRKRSNEIKDKWRFANPEYVKENVRKWAKENPGKRNAQTMRRIAAKLKATPKWLNEEQRNKIQELYIEASKLTKETGIPHEVDHIVPLQGKNVCGLHIPINLRIVTRSENRRKMNKLI